MQRGDWKFSYAVQEILEAAENKRKHHEDRGSWWLGQKQTVIDKIKAEGLTVEESMAPSNMSTAYARGSAVMVRDDLNRDLQECVQKVREHHAHEADYAGWVEVLKSQNPEHRLSLDQADWLYFFSKKR